MSLGSSQRSDIPHTSNLIPLSSALSLQPLALPLRSFLETFVGLCIAVSLVRGLATEGYMISTGSMAPTLVGYHRPATCPHCQYGFTRGSVPAAVRSTHADASTTADTLSEPARCPNCGTHFVTQQPRTEGDQLLVLKHAYDQRLPRRWEVVVFRNPSDPTEAYIKRVAGRPGETIAIRGGDVYADGQLCRKDFETQHAMRLPVADANHPALTPTRWQCEPRWQRTAGTFTHDGPASAIRYRHAARSGGRHTTQVAIANWPTATPPDAPRLVYEDGVLHCLGVLPEDVRDRLLAMSAEESFHTAIRDLAMRSQVGYITDATGYNSPGLRESQVRDLMWSGRVELAAGSRVDINLLYGRQPFVLTLTPSALSLSTLGSQGEPMLLESQARSLATHEVCLSVFDRQLTVALDGEPVWQPVPFEATPLTQKASRKPLTITASGRVVLSDVALWRDVYVTPPDVPEATVVLGPEDLFMLGDNSPVSVDSRRWPVAAIPRRSLIGKPLVVHLPSRQVPLPLVGPVRLPDVTKMRLVR